MTTAKKSVVKKAAPKKPAKVKDITVETTLKIDPDADMVTVQAEPEVVHQHTVPRPEMLALQIIDASGHVLKVFALANYPEFWADSSMCRQLSEDIHEAIQNG